MNQLLGRDPICHHGRHAGKPSAASPDTVPYAPFVVGDIRAIPETCDWGKSITDWGVMGNNQYGNCVPVTAAHIILTWRANELNDATRITDTAVIELSRQMGALRGYNILDRLNYWRKNQMWATPLWAYAGLQPQDKTELCHAIHATGAIDVAVDLPSAWKSAEIWTTGVGRNWAPNSWGPHSVAAVGYDSEFLYCCSWGAIYPMTWPAVDRYVPEVYALISPDWIASDSRSPSGLDLPALHAFLQARNVNDLNPIPTYRNAL